MASLSEEQARAYMHKLLAAMSQAGGSDLFIANDFPPSMKAHGTMQPLSSQKLTGELTRVFANSLMNLGLMIPGTISGKIQMAVGYKSFFIWVVLASIPALILARFIPIHGGKSEAQTTEPAVVG